MFTGLIEEVGHIYSIQEGLIEDSPYRRFRIACKKIRKGMRLGDSISVNGACQTVVAYSSRFSFHTWFDIESLHITIQKTNFSFFQVGTAVNLEQAMSARDKFGGHIVTGHVQSTGTLVKKITAGENTYLFIDINKEDGHYIIEEGSITIDGISLTIAGIGMSALDMIAHKENEEHIKMLRQSVNEHTIMINLIAHTIQHTTMKSISEGDVFNIEYDMFMKYIAHTIQKMK